VYLLLAVLFLLVPLSAIAQTFRGGINGTVTDPSGATVAGATVELLNPATGVVLKTVSSSGGEFTFQEIPLGTYTITVTSASFKPEKVDAIPVLAGKIYTLPVQLSLAAAGETIEISATALTLDTTSTTQTTVVGGKPLQDTPLNGRDFTQLVSLAPGFAVGGAGGYGALNGTRANQINWQIDGIDNNDLWHNIPAVNQGGVSGIAGIVLPIDAIQDFSTQSQASPESGRNPGGSVNLSLKSGTNGLHGSLYYYNRNEFFGATSPFTAPTKQEVRNYNYGFSAGGPIIRDKLFWFVTYEHQRFIIGVPAQSTQPSAAWQAAAKADLAAFNVPVNTVSANMLAALWPAKVTGTLAGDVGGAPTQFNYVSNDPEYGYSYNGLAKIDYNFNEKNQLTAHWFVGQGNQVAPVGSHIKDYYEVAPIHVQNYAIVYNHVFSNSLTNQLLAGVNYFNQVFNDFNNGFDAASLGLITGSTLKGAPNVKINGFDPIGETPPEGRNDITGHLTEDLSWTVGRHQFKFGGEFRKAQLDEFYHRHALGSFTFDGTEGPHPGSGVAWNAGATDTDKLVGALADFLAGNVKSSSIALGDPSRQVFVNTFDFFGQDAWQLSPKLSVNYGLRWDYEGPLHNPYKNLSVFRPKLGGTEIAFQGAQISNLYDPVYSNFSPRVGFSYQVRPNTVLRAGAGLYYDTPNLNPFLDNRPGNNAPNGVEGNPGGNTPVTTATNSGYTIQNGVDVFTSTTPSNSLFSIAQNFVPSHNMNYNLQLEQSLSSKVVAQLGYVGSEGRHLLSIRDINQAAPGVYATSDAQNATRPYYTASNPYTFINEIQSIGTSNYNSLQATIRASNLHGVTLQGAYTWSHSMDIVTSYRGALPQDSFNFKGDYGPSDFDTRNTFIGLVSYEVPGTQKLHLLSKGWEVNSLLTFHGGLPFSVLSSGDNSGTDEGTQRADIVPGVSPYAGGKQSKVGGQWLNPAAFVDPVAGTFGNSSRNAYIAPGYADVDLSVFKNTPITERISTQFRVEMFNVTNRTNFAPPLSASGGVNPNQALDTALTLFDTIGDFNGAPGIGAGEPFNTQLALKIIF
jgi:outer membrane receptor protein involved in Fe transport